MSDLVDELKNLENDHEISTMRVGTTGEATATATRSAVELARGMQVGGLLSARIVPLMRRY